jgi:large subunit ribosomal protein L15
MNLSDVAKITVHRRKTHRIGRGQGSGWGTTSGRGNKGQGSRTGSKDRLRFEGGQMPLYRRLPKKGFTNAPFKTVYHVVNVQDLEKLFEAGATIDLAAIQAVGLAPKNARFLKVLGQGDLTKALTIRAHGVSGAARTKVEGAKGSLTILPTHITHRPKGTKKGAATGKTAAAKGPEGKGPEGKGPGPGRVSAGGRS